MLNVLARSVSDAVRQDIDFETLCAHLVQVAHLAIPGKLLGVTSMTGSRPGEASMQAQPSDGDTQPHPVHDIEQWARQRTAQPRSNLGRKPRSQGRKEQQHEASASAEDSAASDDTAGPALEAATDANGHERPTDQTSSSRRQVVRQQRQAAADLRRQRQSLRQPQEPAQQTGDVQQSGSSHLQDKHDHAGLHAPGQAAEHDVRQQCQHLPQSPLRAAELPPGQRQAPPNLADQLQQAQQQYRQRQQQLQEGLHHQPRQQQSGRRKRPALHPGAAEFRPATAQQAPQSAVLAHADVPADMGVEADACVICCEPAEVDPGACRGHLW